MVMKFLFNVFLLSAISFAVSPGSTQLRAEVRLPHILSDGCVLQRGDTLRLWGTADANERVDVRFRGKKYHTRADASGQWLLYLPPQKAGGPFVMEVGNQQLHDVYVGDVWLTSGQSNMDLQVSRVADLYAAETDTACCPAIHLIQIATRSLPEAPQTDLGGTERWEALQPDLIGHWSAVSYFFAREMYALTGVPQGIINASQGGSAIEAWMSRDAISRTSERATRELDFALTPGYRDRCRAINAAIGKTWNELMRTQDPGLTEGWMREDLDDADWEAVPERQDEIGRTCGQPWRGTLWFRRTFTLPAEVAGREGLLRLGCLVDADEAYINGTLVGSTGYQYPPRKYKVPAGVLHAGNNTLCIRLTTGGSAVKFVAQKPYELQLGDYTLPLAPQTYCYKRGVMMPSHPGAPTFDNLATGYYNGMIAPLLPYRIGGIIWYQGETNTGRPDEYQPLLEALAADWRNSFGSVPLLIVQLAGFMERHTYPYNSNWAALREAQRRASTTIPRAALATAIDLGEQNDIHPLSKKPLAQRLALQARRLYLGDRQVVCQGPVPLKATVITQTEATAAVAADNCVIRISFSTDADAVATMHDDGRSFAVAGADRKFHWATAQNDGNTVLLRCPDVKAPKFVRYAWDDFPQLSLFGISGLPASPFELEVE
jgi:sialate O-acetylesterase